MEQIRPPVYPAGMPPAHTLSPADQYASYLRAVYTSKKLPTYSKWPPSSSTKFIHLAVVRKEYVSKKEADEFTKATIHGTEIDDIYRRKEAVDFSRVGKKEDGSLAKLILVEGAPGIGKTTFAWEVCRKWASGEILQEYGLVVLLRLRDKRVREVKTVFDLFYHPNPELSCAVGKVILHHEGESVLLLYEGYDELPRKLQDQQSIFLDVLHKNCLPRATILITSRPSATEYLRWEFKKHISQHIEILGFTKDDIIFYVHDVMEDEQLCKDFFQYLKCYPYIRGMMYVPLNAVIVTEVYKSSQQSPEKFIPTTMTELYTALTRSLLLRYLHSHSEYGQRKWNLKVFTDLPKELYKQFCDVTAVALKGMIEDTFVFDDLPNDFNALDLMQSVPELYVEQGALVSYNFFHLTLQEYLAAVNISQQHVEKQIEFFQTSESSFDEPIHNLLFTSEMHQPLCDPLSDATFDPFSTSEMCPALVHRAMPHSRPPHSHTPHHENPSYSQLSSIPIPSTTTVSQLGPSASSTQLSLRDTIPGISTRLRNVLRFVAGLTKFKRIPLASLQPLVLGSKDMTLKSLHWLFEAQCSDTYNELVNPYHLLIVHPSNMLPFDYFVLGYAMAHITSHWVIDLSYREIDNECIEMLVAGVTFERDDFTRSKENRALRHLDVSYNSIGDGGATALAEILRTLQQLNVSHNSIGDGGATALAEMLKENRTLQQLDVSSNSIGDVGATALAEMLKENGTLKQLNVSGSFSIGDGGATALAEMLKENRTLQQLDVSSNSIGNVGATALAEMLKENRTLQQLDVSSNSIGNVGATALAEMLKENRTLQQLDFCSNSIGDGGATALAEMLKENRTLQQLDFCSNSIGDGGATALAEMLKENRTFQQLDVSNNSIGDVGATALAEMLKENRTIQQLNVSGSFSIGDGGATALAEMLKENRTLQQLDVSSNSIGNVGATALAEVLKENRTLQQLDVSNNSIGNVGATALAEMLKENRMVQQLDVSSNSIGDGGATALVEMLKENRTLQQLDVSSNSIGDGGATALVEMLKENRTLQQLNVSSVGKGGVTALVKMLEEIGTLRQLNVSKISIYGTIISCSRNTRLQNN